MGYHDYTIYTNSVLIGHLLSYKIIVVMIYFFPLNLSSSGVLKGHDSIRGSGPLTVDRPWEAAASKGRGWGILTSPLTQHQERYCKGYLSITFKGHTH